MISPRLRPATPEDVPRLKDLGVLGWETTYQSFISAENRASYLAGPFWSLDRLASIVADPASLTLVAADSTEVVVGFLTIETVNGDAIELTRFYVDSTLRGSGLGSILFDSGLAWARERGARTMLVNVFASNHGGRRFYERAGFTLTRLEPYAIGDQIVGDAWYERGVR
jgi:ribosomal-protein-alanine N-acetyltransferase